MSREYLPCPPQMRNGGPPPAHLPSSTAFALDESQWLYPPQRAPDALGQSISDFLAQCRQIETDGREALVAHHEECSRYWAEKMRNGGSPPAHLSSSTAFALKKDFYHHREEAELVNKFDNEGLRLMTEERRRNKAARAKAFDNEWLRLKNEARIAFNNEERRCHRHLRALIERLRQHEAARVKGVDDERLRLMAKERCCHDAATQMAMSAARSCADVHHCHEAAAQAAESAVRLLAEDRQQHEATELATISPMRSLTASRDRANIEAIAYKALALPTTTSPEPPAMLSPSPRPKSLYLGAVLNTNGGGAFVAAFDIAYRAGSNITFRRQRGVG